ncbi:HPF/RaiA family ribosome-associated protein, partial [Mesorhizobium sp.]
MNLRISGKHMDIGDAFRTRINDRVNEAIEKYFDRGFSGHVTVIKAGSRFSADCMIRLDSGASLQATGDAQDPTLAFEAA